MNRSHNPATRVQTPNSTRAISCLAAMLLMLGNVSIAQDTPSSSSGTSQEATGSKPEAKDSSAAGDAKGGSTSDPAAGWPEVSQKAAQSMIQKYGPPAEVTPTMLVWHKNGPWKRTVVYKDPVPHKFPKAHEDVLEQFVSYRVPTDKFDELAQFDGSVIVERTKGVISARCDKEPMNILALNLAHDVATGKKSVDEARKAYAQQAMAFMKKESAPYTEKLQFEPQENSGDPDEPAPAMKSGASGSGSSGSGSSE